MAKFDTEELREEEKIGGFEPGSDEDDSFKLESMDAYAGILPDYGPLAEEEKISIASQINIPDVEVEEVTDEAEEGEGEGGTTNVWDLFGQDSAVEVPTDDDMYIPEPDEDIDNEKPEEEIEEPEEEQSPHEDINAEAFFEGPAKDVEEAPPQQQGDINFLDPELKKLVSEEAKRAKTRTTSKEETVSIEEINEQEAVNDFLAQDNISEEIPEVPIENNITEPLIDDEMETRKKLKLWKTFGIIAAVLFVMALIVHLEYFIRFQPKGYTLSEAIMLMPPFDWFSSNSATISKVAEHKEPVVSEKPEENSNSKIKGKHKKNDTIKKIAKNEEVATQKQPIKEEITETHTEIPKKINNKEKPKTVTKKIANNENYEAKPVNHSTPIKSKDKIVKEIAQELYIVQVYTSPYKDDAEEWLKQLRRKSVANPFISTQKIRDKVWYRVRFGAYKNADEARTEALKLGFAQTWIDRVR